MWRPEFPRQRRHPVARSDAQLQRAWDSAWPVADLGIGGAGRIGPSTDRLTTSRPAMQSRRGRGSCRPSTASPAFSPSMGSPPVPAHRACERRPPPSIAPVGDECLRQRHLFAARVQPSPTDRAWIAPRLPAPVRPRRPPRRRPRRAARRPREGPPPSSQKPRKEAPARSAPARRGRDRALRENGVEDNRMASRQDRGRDFEHLLVDPAAGLWAVGREGSGSRVHLPCACGPRRCAAPPPRAWVRAAAPTVWPGWSCRTPKVRRSRRAGGGADPDAAPPPPGSGVRGRRHRPGRSRGRAPRPGPRASSGRAASPRIGRRACTGRFVEPAVEHPLAASPRPRKSRSLSRKARS